MCERRRTSNTQHPISDMQQQTDELDNSIAYYISLHAALSRIYSAKVRLQDAKNKVDESIEDILGALYECVAEPKEVTSL